MSDEQVKIRVDGNYRSMDVLIEVELCQTIMKKYTRFYLCSFILDVLYDTSSESIIIFNAF